MGRFYWTGRLEKLMPEGNWDWGRARELGGGAGSREMAWRACVLGQIATFWQILESLT